MIRGLPLPPDAVQRNSARPSPGVTDSCSHIGPPEYEVVVVAQDVVVANVVAVHQSHVVVVAEDVVVHQSHVVVVAG